jgi:hypothetical protein
MSSAIPPFPYFNGITYNPSLFSSSTDYITATTGKKLFLSYPTAQGEETFASNVLIKSSLTDGSGSKGLSGQVLSSTVSGTQWIYSGSSGYLSYNLSSLPFTLPAASYSKYSNLYILFTGTVGSGGIMTIPITGFTAGTLINIKNASTGTVNFSTTYMLYVSTTTSTTIFGIGGGDVIQLYFNGSYWIENSLSNKIAYLTVTNTLTLTGGFAVNSLVMSSSGSDIDLYGTTTANDILIGQTLPAGKTVRIANTTAGAAGASVHCANIGIDNSNINNATAPTTGILKLGQSQTTGTLYVGGGAATAARTTGPIVIGSDSTASGGINIGTGTNLVDPAVNTVNIGSGTYGTIIKGALTTSTAITLPTTPPTLTTSNLGYSYNFSSTTVSGSAIATYYLYSPGTNTAGAGNYLNAGVYAVYVSSQAYELNSPTTGLAAYTIGVCYGTATGLISTSALYGTSQTSKALSYTRQALNNVRIGNSIAYTFTLSSASFVNLYIYTSISVAFSSGNLWEIIDGTIIRIA